MAQHGDERQHLIENKQSQTGFGIDNEPEISIEEVEERQPRVSNILNTEEYCTVYKVRHNLNNVSDLLERGAEIDDMFYKMVQKNLDKAKDGDMVSVALKHSELKKNIWVSHTRKGNFNREALLNRIYRVSQSQRSFLADGRVEVRVHIVRNVSHVTVNPVTPNPV